MKRYLPFVIIAVVLAAAIGAGVLMFRSAQPRLSGSSTPAGSPVTTPNVASNGSNGVVLIEEYGDYQCPPCGALHPVLKSLKNEYGNRIRLDFHHYPLTAIHKHALEASYAAAAANLQGKFWEMHNLLYENQSLWSEVGDFRPIAINFARQLGLDVARFTRDMDGLKVMGLVSSDSQRAEALGVNSTPTVFINGHMIPFEDLTTEKLRTEINKSLSVSP